MQMRSSKFSNQLQSLVLFNLKPNDILNMFVFGLCQIHRTPSFYRKQSESVHWECTMKICKQCDIVYKDNIQYCPQCGSPLTQAQGDMALLKTPIKNPLQTLSARFQAMDAAKKKRTILIALSPIAFFFVVVGIWLMTISPAQTVMKAYVKAINQCDIVALANTIYPVRSGSAYNDFIEEHRTSYFEGMDKVKLHHVKVLESYGKEYIRADVLMTIESAWFGTIETHYEVHFLYASTCRCYHLASDIDYVEERNFLPSSWVHPELRLGVIKDLWMDTLPNGMLLFQPFGREMSLHQITKGIAKSTVIEWSDDELKEGFNDITLRLTTKNGYHTKTYSIGILNEGFQVDVWNGIAWIAAVNEEVEHLVFPFQIGSYPLDLESFDLRGHNNLKTVVFQEGFVRLGNNLFVDCPLLESIQLPDSLEEIGYDSLRGLPKLETIRLPKNLHRIDSFGLYNLSGLRLIEVDPMNLVFSVVDGVLYREDDEYGKVLMLYPGADERTSFVLPESVGSIRSGFESAVHLESITLSGTLRNLNEGTFAHCVKLTNIAISGDNPSLIVIDDVLYSADLHTLYQFPPAKEILSYRIHSAVVKVGDGSFMNASKLQEVIIPSHVLQITSGAFKGNLSIVRYIAEGESLNLQTIDGVLYKTAFDTSPCLLAYPPAKPEITFIVPDFVIYIDDYAFLGAKHLVTLILSEGVRSIYEGAFQGLSELRSVDLPSTLTYIAIYAFTNSPKLETVMIRATQRTTFYDLSKTFDLGSTRLKIYVPASLLNGYIGQDPMTSAYFRAIP